VVVGVMVGVFRNEGKEGGHRPGGRLQKIKRGDTKRGGVLL